MVKLQDILAELRTASQGLANLDFTKPRLLDK
jgi:hypothetical protein